MASVSLRLTAPTSKAPRHPNPKLPKVFPSLFTSAFVQCDPQRSKLTLTIPDESSLRHFRTHAKAIALVSRSGFMRRDALLGMLLAASSCPFLALESLAETDFLGSFWAYEDETNKFRIFVPKDENSNSITNWILDSGATVHLTPHYQNMQYSQNYTGQDNVTVGDGNNLSIANTGQGILPTPSRWSVGTGETTSIKSVTAFYPEEASNSNVSITIAGVGPDFTSLGSFGKVDAFAETLVNGLDRSWQRPPGIAAKLINSAAANGLYYIEYTLQKPGEKCRHIFSAIGIASNGWYNRLYTVTGQFMDDVEENYKSLVEKSVLSFRLI